MVSQVGVNPTFNYEDDYPGKNGEQRLLPAVSTRSLAHDTDRHNGALMRQDERLVRLLRAYSRLGQASRDALILLAELEASAPRGES